MKKSEDKKRDVRMAEHRGNNNEVVNNFRLEMKIVRHANKELHPQTH